MPMETNSSSKRQFERHCSLPNIDENEILKLDSASVKPLGKRRVSIAIGESTSQLTTFHLNSQKPLSQTSKRRGSDLSIGTQRRLSRASVDSRFTAPDGGYGWVVVAACLTTNCLSLGLIFAFAVYYVTFLQVFGESKSFTSWIGSIMGSTMFFIGKHRFYFTNRHSSIEEYHLGIVSAVS